MDEAIDVLDMLILDITREAKKTGQKKRLRMLKDLDRAALLLARACSLLLDELARPQNNNFHDEMVEQYGRVKRFLPAGADRQSADTGGGRCAASSQPGITRLPAQRAVGRFYLYGHRYHCACGSQKAEPSGKI